MKKSLTYAVWHVLTIACMAAIFYFSSQNAQMSSNTSSRFIMGVAGFIISDFKEMPQADQMLLVDNWQHAARKYAHFSAFFALGLSAAGAARTYKINFKAQLAAAFAIVFLYAVSDEIHQLFVPGRAAAVGDVLIDTAGGLTGILALLGFRKLRMMFADKYI